MGLIAQRDRPQNSAPINERRRSNLAEEKTCNDIVKHLVDHLVLEEAASGRARGACLCEGREGARRRVCSLIEG